LRKQGRHITIETAATLYLDLECDLMSLSPKLAGSGPRAEQAGRWRDRHERTRHQPKVVERLIDSYDYQVKFVVDSPADCQDVEDYLDVFPKIDQARVMLMPCGTDEVTLARHAEWLEPYCRKHGLRFCPRKQIEWFGLARGT
jgi:7-carboxy-7-deazaguanine synthase